MTEPCSRCAELSKAVEEVLNKIVEHANTQMALFREGNDEKFSELEKAFVLAVGQKERFGNTGGNT